ncbi:hypothetical protein AVEN_157208-1 [Araneus ventricosus]|uniref:Fibronectin type-III domain-containing protein n=1 Tax=Araneus ventricosus TaxID=182803 RepID=A0A4Y2EGY8_ARAVE|nr:hypothetical protein AVEN_157208-1 [Araneus ventricosus]
MAFVPFRPTISFRQRKPKLFSSGVWIRQADTSVLSVNINWAIKIEPPAEVQNCSAAEETESSFKVFCNASFDESNDLDEHFYVEIRELATGELLQNFSLNFPEVAVRGLDPGTWYSVSVLATNEAGRSKPYLLEIHTLSRPATTNVTGTRWNMESSPLIFIIGAGSGGLLLVVIIICCALKFRLSRRKSKDSLSGQANEKSVHNSEKSGDSCSEGCTCSGREEEKIRENIPDVVVFSEKAKSEEAERLKYSSSSAYWNPITLSADQEISPQSKLKVISTFISILMPKRANSSRHQDISMTQ